MRRRLVTRTASAGRVAGLLVCALLLPSFLRAQGSGQDTIRGKVSGPGGRPVEVKVQLRNQAGYVVDTVYSDSQGDFTFQAVHDGTYHVFVDDERFRVTEVMAHVVWTLMPVDSVYLGLEPRNSTMTTSGRDDSQTVSVNELKSKFPKSAVKEYEKGNERMQRGDPRGAISHYKKALAEAPTLSLALNNLGNAYLQTREMAKAQATLERAVASDPTAADPLVNLGHLYYETQRFPQAEQALQRGLDLDPRAALGYFFLGLTEVRLGKTRDAALNLQQALNRNDPRVVSAHLVLAELYMNTQPEKAREHLEEYLRLRPEDPQADRIRQALARLRVKTTP